MKLTDVRLMLICILGAVLTAAGLEAMTIQLGSADNQLIAVGEDWRFFRGTVPPSDPPDAWQEEDFNDADWETGKSGFGYGDGDDATVLDDMEDNYVTVYIRKRFEAPPLPAGLVVQLVIDYDDGFIAYLNDDKVADKHMPGGTPTYTTTASSHEAGTPETIALGTVGDLLNDGNNVLAIEGHNVSKGSSDFSLIPALRTQPLVARNGQTWIVETAEVTLNGSTDAPEAVSVMVGGAAAQFNPADGSWQAEVSLAAGLNTITAEALDAGAGVVDSGSAEIIYVPPEKVISGEITEDATWSGEYIVEDTAVVGAGVVLTIEPGAVIFMKQDASLVVYGQLLADGTEALPIRFTHCGDETAWKQIMFIEAQDSRFANCIFEYAESEGEHQDYYDDDCNPATTRPSKPYHEALVALATHLDFEGCTFQKLLGGSSGTEGDAIAIVSDEPQHPGEASANIIACRFVDIGQGVHTRYAYVRIERCYFRGKKGDNDDVDLYGESTPPPLILNNLFDMPEHDDRINPTRCSAIIIGNVIRGGDDHGIVLRDRCSPVAINNIVANCRNGGIVVENTCTALLVNNTIWNTTNGPGLKFFDLGRASPGYCLAKGGGSATVINCIVWDNQTSISLADSHQLDGEPNAGSHITVMYSNIEGGKDDVSFTRKGGVLDSTLTWLDGNIDADPQFADPGAGDFHLKSLVGRWDAVAKAWVKDQITSPCIDAGTAYTFDDPNYPYFGVIDYRGELWPHGGLINMGAYGATPQASMSEDDTRGSAADVDYDGFVRLLDFAALARQWSAEEHLLVEDLNRDGLVDFADLLLMAQKWLWQDSL